MSPEWVVADAVVFEPVSHTEMGKIMGKTRQSPRVEERRTEKACGTGIFDDSEVEK
jgi:hypothetical protein